MLLSTIQLTSEPKGTYLEGTISGSNIFPGTIMSVLAATNPISGEFSWQVCQNGADGNVRMPAVLLEDRLQGFSYATAYVTGARCFLYVPIKGEYMNIMCAGEAGTGSANAHAIGDRFILQNNTGLLVVATTNAQVPIFICMEHIDIPADTAGLVWAMCAY